MKARPVRGVRPERSFRRNAALVISVRLDELFAFDPEIRDPEAVAALHDMRIAAKRVRYVLEISGFAFGPEAAAAEHAVRELQETLGDIHDCDVLLPLVDQHLQHLRAEDAVWLASLGRGHKGLAHLEAQTGRAPNRVKYRGLEVLAAALVARRRVLYDSFVARWDEQLLEGWRPRLEAVLAESTGGGAQDGRPNRKRR